MLHGMSSVAKWASDLRYLHEQAKAGKLTNDERQLYEVAREQLARAAVAMQNTPMKAGDTPRKLLRVARSLQVDLDLPSGRLRVPTLDLAITGFTALIATTDLTHDRVAFILRMPTGDPIKGQVRMIHGKNSGASIRASFMFDNMTDEERARVELVVIDTVLSMLNV